MVTAPVARRPVGRDAEVAAVAGCLRGLDAGRAQVTHLLGESGVGKSTVLTEALKQLTASSPAPRVVIGRAEELQRGRSFGPLLDALRGLGEAAAEEYAHLELALAAGTDEYGVQERILAALEAAALTGPTVVVLEDLHWADAATLRTLQLAARHLADVPLGLLSSSRPPAPSTPLAGWVDAVAAATGAVLLALDPLGPAAVGQLLRDRLGALPGPRLRALAARAGGNPFLLTELLDGLSADELLVEGDGVVELGTEVPGRTFSSSLVRFAAASSPESVELLRLVAIVGGSVTVGTLCELTGRPATEVLGVLEAARLAGLVDTDADGVTFRHDLIREALYADLSDPARRSLHAAVAEALHTRGYLAGIVAEHLLLAGDAADPALVRRLGREAAEVMDLSLRAELLTRLLQLLPPGEERRQAAAACVTALAGTERLTDAEAVVDAELAVDPGSEARLRAALACAYGDRLRGADAMAAAERVLSLPGVPPQVRLEMEARRAAALFLTGATDEAVAVARGVLADPDARTEAGTAEVIGLQVLSSAALCAGDHPRAAEHALAAVAAETPWSPSASHLLVFPPLIAEDRFDEAEEALRTAYTRLRAMRFGTPQPHCTGFASLLALLAGRLDDASSVAESALSAFADWGGPQGSLYSRAVLARAAVHRGDLDDARRWADPADTPPAEVGADWWLWAAASLSEAAGDQAGAFASLRAWWDLFGPLRNYAGGMIVFAADLARLARAEGEPGLLAELAAALDNVAAHTSAPSAHGAALLVRGLARDDGELLEASVAAYARGPRPLATARAREVLGEVRPDRAAEQWSAALAAYEGLGAAGDAERVAARLGRPARRGGGRRGLRPDFGWASITPSERQVVDLALTGLTMRRIAERLCVSPHTVETHLRHVYRKLGVASRMELFAAARPAE